MKRILGLMVLVGVLMIPSVGSADQIGIYVAPKFVYGLTQMRGVKVAEDYDYAGSLPPGTTPSSGNLGSHTDNTFGGSIAIGYDFSKKFNVPVRTELEYAAFSTAEAKHHQRIVFDDTDHEDLWNKQTYQIQTLFINAYWDINTGTKFTPYLGAGLGMGFIGTKARDWGASYNPADPYGPDRDEFDNPINKKTRTNFAWNIGAGVGYDITDNWTIDAGYRFVGLGSVKSGNNREYDDNGDFLGNSWFKTRNLYHHQFAIGLRFTF